MILPGEAGKGMRERRRFLVPIPPGTSPDALQRLGEIVHAGRIPHLEVEAESRAEARELATELLADVTNVWNISALPTATAAQLANNVVYRTKYGRR